MVALLTSDPIYRRPSAPPASWPVPPEQRHLQAVPHISSHLPVPSNARSTARGTNAVLSAKTGLPSSSTIAIDPVWLGIALVVLALGLLTGFRALQGSPPPGTWADVQQATRFVAPGPTAGDRLMTVQPGQTLWGIAEDVAPGADRREVVQILTAANGSAAIWAGQELVIPAALVGTGGESASG